MSNKYTLGIDIGSTTVKIAILDENDTLLFADYQRHFANIQETLAELLTKAYGKLGELTLHPVITGSGGLTLANHLGVPFVQEVIAVSTSLQKIAPQTDVAIELGGEDAKIIYFEGGNIEQRMNGICAGGTGSFIDQMASLLQTDATGLNEYAKNYKALYPIAARCGVFAKTDIPPVVLHHGRRRRYQIVHAITARQCCSPACRPLRQLCAKEKPPPKNHINSPAKDETSERDSCYICPLSLQPRLYRPWPEAPRWASSFRYSWSWKRPNGRRRSVRRTTLLHRS